MQQKDVDPRFRAISELPVGLEVEHIPPRVKAIQDGRRGMRYTWIHKTRVRSSVGPVKIVEFGAFAWYQGRWEFFNITGKPFTPSDFADWYSCPGAELLSDKPYIDPNNWSGANQLNGTRAMWYYVAEDQQGRRFKGTAIVEALPELQD